MSPDALHAHSRSLLPLDARRARTRALEVFSERYLIVRLLARLLPANRRASGGWDQEVALGHGWAEVEGRLLIVRVEVVEPIGRRPAQLDGDQYGTVPQKTHRVISGVDAVGGK